jgi:conjugative relaxase-like TrwC/TraI family protein
LGGIPIALLKGEGDREAVLIATMKVLGLRARDFRTVAGAARRIVRYLEGSGASEQATLSRYYGGTTRVVAGRARGASAGLVGLKTRVGPRQLQRLLEGRHAVTGAPLLAVRGSAGRSQASHGEIRTRLVDAPEVLTLSEAARFADVSPAYLRRLAEDHELEASATTRASSADADRTSPSANEDGAAAFGIRAGESRDYLRAFRSRSGRRWLVERAEVARFMGERQPPTVVIGYDLTCSAPKSVSLLWAFGDQTLRDDVAAALDAGVDAAIGYLEQHAVVGTVGRRNRPGLGLAVASYRHEISRSEEAHLHLHNIIVNAVPVPLLDTSRRPVLDELGVARVEWRALDGEVLLRHVKTAGYVGAAALRHDLARRRGLSWGPVRNGVSEIEGFPPELLDAFSTRRGGLTQEFTHLVEAGLPADAQTMASAQRESRAAKRVLSDPQVEAIQQQKLAEAGWSVDQVRALGAHRQRDLTAPTQADVEAFFDHLVGPSGLTQHNAVFGHREVVQAVAAWAGDRLGPEAITRLVEEFLADPRIVLLESQRHRRRNQDEQAYTTSELLAVEHTLIRLYRQGRVDHGGPPQARIPPELADAAIRAINQRLRSERPGDTVGLSGEQSDLVRSLLGSADLVRPVIGPAGTGKTEAMRAVVQAFTSDGRQVLGTANGGRQAQDLHERLDIRTQVVAGWLTLLDHTGDPSVVWAPGTVLIVDEATQISTRDGERLLRYATRTATVLILVGDGAQLGSVGAGGWFRHLVQITPTSRG